MKIRILIKSSLNDPLKIYQKLIKEDIIKRCILALL